MEEKMSNSDPDVGPPLKKARFQWQIKGQQGLKVNDMQLKSFQGDVVTCEEEQEINTNKHGFSPVNCATDDIATGSELETVIEEHRFSPVCFATAGVVSCSSDIIGLKTLDANDTHAKSFHNQATTEVNEHHEEDVSHLVIHNCPGSSQNLSVCPEAIPAARNVIKAQSTGQDTSQNDHKHRVNVPSNENICSSCPPVTLMSNSSKDLHVETSCVGNRTDSMATTIIIETFCEKSLCAREKNLICDNSCYDVSEPGTSTDNISVEAHENPCSPCVKSQEVLSLESSNTNFMDLIQTKVDIQARKLNLLNMVQANRQDDTLSEDNTSTITSPSKTLSLSQTPQSSSTSRDDFSTNTPSTQTAYIPGENVPIQPTTSEQEVSVAQHSSQPNLDQSNSQNPSDDQSFLCRWQSHHTAKAIVDNAINKTLEEMGLTPDVSTSAWNRLFLEDEGINEAIRLRGLWLRESNIQSGRIHPLISQITEASEQVFEQSLRNTSQIFRPVESEIDPRTEGLDLLESNVDEHNPCGCESSSDSDSHLEADYPGAASEPALAAADDVLQIALNAAITSKGLSL